VGGWYTIGVCLGLGLGIGLILSGILASTTAGVGAAAVVGTAAGVGLGFAIGDVPEAVAGGIAGFLGALSAAAVVYGALRRGATRFGLAAYVGAVGVLVCLVSLVPVAGYVAVVGVPVLAARLRGRRAARFAGLRTLAK
jgi:hypothetical protein